jgi:FixJ family two-component response regulator
MPKASLVSVVEDDPFFRESMRRLMRSVGYAVEAFPAAVDFLNSPRLIETACSMADVHIPPMTGLELSRHLANAGYAIPTILVTAYPDEDAKANVLKVGVVCNLRKAVNREHLMRCIDAALKLRGTTRRSHDFFLLGLSTLQTTNSLGCPIGPNCFSTSFSEPMAVCR